jgi:hypothetical protein
VGDDPQLPKERKNVIVKDRRHRVRQRDVQAPAKLIRSKTFPSTLGVARDGFEELGNQVVWGDVLDE